MRRLAIALVMVPLAGMAGLALLSPVAEAHPQTTPPTDPGGAGETVADDLAPVDVLQVSGLFDEVTVDSIHDALDRAERTGSQALILQLNTGGAIVGDDEMRDLIVAVRDSPVAVGLWVGPAKSARAYGTPAQLFAVADVTGMVEGSRLGYTGEPLDPSVDFGAAGAQLEDGSMSYDEARAAGVLKLGELEGALNDGVPTVRSMVVVMDGTQLEDGTILDTVVVQLDADGDEQNVATLVRFSGLGLLEELFHTMASPAMAYLFFVIGGCLLIFEFFTAGVGIAGTVGALLTLAGSYGLSALPARVGAVALIIIALLAFAVDVQVGIPRFWTGVGIVTFVLGSWFLYEPLPGHDLRLGWLTLSAGIIGVMLTFIVGMPSMVRTRFATPTIGREWMIGAEGSAVGSIDPEGIAQVGNAKWRARTNRATPIAAGETLKVAAIDGVTLEVEPLEGAARDYRERRSTSES